MDDLSVTWLIAIQVGFLLLGTIIFQWLYNRWQKSKLLKFKIQLQKLRELLAAQKTQATRHQDEGFLDIESSLSETQERHNTIDNSSDIDTLYSLNAKDKINSLALRHAFLNAEKQAISENSQEKWDALDQNFQKIISTLSLAEFDGVEKERDQYKQELDLLKKELLINTTSIEELEQKKTLIEGLQKNWGDLKQSENSIMPKIVSLIKGSENRNEMAELLKELHTEFEKAGSFLSEETGDTSAEQFAIDFFDETENTEIDSELTDTKNSDSAPHDAESQMNMLTNITNDQTKLIAKLKNQLTELNGDDQLAETIEEVERLNQMMKESEMCIKLLETELDESSNRALQSEKENAELANATQEKDSRISELEANLSQQTTEATQLSQQLEMLENETASLPETPDSPELETDNIELFDDSPTPESTEINAITSNDSVIDFDKIITQKQYEIYELEEKQLAIETRYLQLYQRYQQLVV
ncbi:MAG: hypothetical protein KUG82_17500 [Pseudomonadales bacterium]|nr:hypothetical protein [Pseudomonadales bacterium]